MSYVIFVFMFMLIFCPAPVKPGLERFRLVDHSDVDLVGAGATFYLDRHASSLSFLFSLRLAVWRCGLAD